MTEDSPAPDAAAVEAEVRAMLRGLAKLTSDEGIDEARYITLGGARQWISIRGQNRRAPVLLYLHGGPGGAISDLGYVFQKPWEDYFVVVHWDQRGFGRSAIDADKLTGTINIDQYLKDLVELIEYLKSYLSVDKVVVLGQSWGTMLTLEIARRRPDLLHAAAMVGLCVDRHENFLETRRLLIEECRALGDKAALEPLEGLGALPPSTDFPAWIAWLQVVQSEMSRRGYSWRAFRGEGVDFSQAMGMARRVAPVSDIEVPSVAAEWFQTAQSEINASVADWSAETAVGLEFDVPMVIMSGAFDWQTPVTLARAYFDKISAPFKKYVEFPHSAHVVLMEEPGRFVVTLVQDVLPAVDGKVPPGAVVRREGPTPV